MVKKEKTSLPKSLIEYFKKIKTNGLGSTSFEISTNLTKIGFAYYHFDYVAKAL
jgi:hypothetical protein